VWGYVARQDLSELIEAIKAYGSNAERAAIDPRVLFALWLYARLDGVGSERECVNAQARNRGLFANAGARLGQGSIGGELVHAGTQPDAHRPTRTPTRRLGERCACDGRMRGQEMTQGAKTDPGARPRRQSRVSAAQLVRVLKGLP
jgi:hypothetical protein